MHDRLETLTAPARAGRVRIVDTGAAGRSARAALLREAHAGLQRAEANLLALAAPHRPAASARPPLFRRHA